MHSIKYTVIILLSTILLFSGCNDSNIKRQKEEYNKKKNTQNQPSAKPEKIEVKYSNKVIELNDRNFDSYIAKGITLVDFWAVWCRPCKIQNPIVEEIALELGDSAHICKMNIDSNRIIPGRFNVRSIPTIIIFKDGKPVKQLVGVQPKLQLINLIRSNL